jgi:hypothetical protein
VLTELRKENMTDEVVVTNYKCSECEAPLTSEGTEALDHMMSEHGYDPEDRSAPSQPYLIPVE